MFGQIDELKKPITVAQQKKPQNKATFDRMLEVGMKLAAKYNENPRAFKSHKAAQRLACLLGRCGVDTSTGIGHITDTINMVHHEGPGALTHAGSEIITKKTTPKFATNPDYLAKASHERGEVLERQARRKLATKKIKKNTELRF